MGGAGDVLIAHLDKNKPGIIPAAVALRVVAHAPFGVVERLAAEGVVASQPAQLVEHVVGRHVVGPGLGHGALERDLVFFRRGGGYAFDAAELGEGVDAVGV